MTESKTQARLFRSEVLAARTNDWMGVINVVMPIPYSWLATLSLALCLALLGISVFGHYSRHEEVIGELVPSKGLLTVVAPSLGVVSHILVREGDVVDEDQALVEISTESNSVTAGKTRATIADELRSQLERSKLALADHGRLNAKKIEGLKDRIAILRVQMHQIDEQIRIQSQIAESAHALWKKLQPVATQGIVSGIQIEQQKNAAFSASAECASVKRQRADILQQIATLQGELEQLPLNEEQERVELQKKIAELDQAVVQNESQRAIVLRAPQAGVVSNMLVKNGQTVAAAQRLLSVLPHGSEMEAEIWVPSKSVGFLATGNRVVIRYDAFPYQEFGQQFGQVADVSRSAASTSELEGLIGRKANEPHYRVIVQLDRQNILAYGREKSLRPGMRFQADILLGTRRIADWIFEPLMGFKRFGSTLEGRSE